MRCFFVAALRWRLVQALLSDADMLEVVKCSYCACFLLVEEKNISPDTCACSCATQSVDVLGLAMRFFLCAAAAQTWSHDAFVSNPMNVNSNTVREVKITLHYFMFGD